MRYCMGIRSKGRLCEDVHLDRIYRLFCRLDRRCIVRWRYARRTKEEQPYRSGGALEGGHAPGRAIDFRLRSAWSRTSHWTENWMPREDSNLN